MIHDNYAGNAEWMLDWVRVKTEEQDIKFMSRKWLTRTPCNMRLQQDLYAPILGGSGIL